MAPCRRATSVLLTCLLAPVQESTARHEGSPLGECFVTLSDSSSGESETKPARGVRGGQGMEPQQPHARCRRAPMSS